MDAEPARYECLRIERDRGLASVRVLHGRLECRHGIALHAFEKRLHPTPGREEQPHDGTGRVRLTFAPDGRIFVAATLEIDESALVDGLTRPLVLLRVLLPLARPGMLVAVNGAMTSGNRVTTSIVSITCCAAVLSRTARRDEPGTTRGRLVSMCGAIGVSTIAST